MLFYFFTYVRRHFKFRSLSVDSVDTEYRPPCTVLTQSMKFKCNMSSGSSELTQIICYAYLKIRVDSFKQSITLRWLGRSGEVARKDSRPMRVERISRIVRGRFQVRKHGRSFLRNYLLYIHSENRFSNSKGLLLILSLKTTTPHLKKCCRCPSRFHGLVPERWPLKSVHQWQ